MRIGLLTGGADCPGLNAAIRAVTRRAILTHDDTVLGIRNGWEGLIDGNIEPISLYSVSGILHKGGTILGTSRRNPLIRESDVQNILKYAKLYEIDTIIAIGGDDTFKVANYFTKQGLRLIGIPKAVDNDVPGTDLSFGFDTAVSVATDAIDRLHTTAEAHHRVMILEVMGRYSGAIAAMAGIAGGADCILVPEDPFSFQDVIRIVESREKHGKTFSIVVIAEGAICKDPDVENLKPTRTDEFGHQFFYGRGDFLRRELEERCDMEVRVAVLGHIQRGGTPTAFDRMLATRFGVRAADLAHEGKSGVMTALRGTEIVETPLEVVDGKPRGMDAKLLELARISWDE